VRTLYVTGITTSLLAFLGGMATCAVIIWVATGSQPSPSAPAPERAIPLSIQKAHLDVPYRAVSEEVPGFGVRFPGRCQERFGYSLGCLTVREATSVGMRLGLMVQRMDGCSVCRDLGLQAGDVITHLGRGIAPQRTFVATPDLARWLQHLPAVPRTAPVPPLQALTLRILRDGDPVLLTRGPPLAIDGEGVH